MNLTITLHTHYTSVLMRVLEQAELLTTFGSSTAHTEIVLYGTEEQYREWQLWLGAALGCGLLYGGRIERQ